MTTTREQVRELGETVVTRRGVVIGYVTGYQQDDHAAFVATDTTGRFVALRTTLKEAIAAFYSNGGDES